MVASLLNEARAAARIEGEHVARVTDVATLEDGRPYMVIEYLEGSDLGQWLDASGPLPVAEAVDYLLRPWKRSRRPTRAGSFTATSNRRTCFWPDDPTGRRS